jgi:hypothetical protein
MDIKSETKHLNNTLLVDMTRSVAYENSGFYLGLLPGWLSPESESSRLGRRPPYPESRLLRLLGESLLPGSG